MSTIEVLAEKFCDTFYKREWPGELVPDVSDVSMDEAYHVQDLVAKMRAGRGETVVGFKVGCTSTAIRNQFGLQEPICGRLFTPHVFGEDVALDWRNFANCAIEPEMVLKIGKELGDKDLSDDALIDAIEYVSSGIELHHFKFWHLPPTSQELICSGGIHAGLVIGNQKVSPETLPFRDEMFKVYKDETFVTEAPASEIMGGPLKSLRWLVNFLVQRGECLLEGSYVIPGSPTELVVIDCDTNLTVDIECVGRLTTAFKQV